MPGIWWGFVVGYGSISLICFIIVLLSDWDSLSVEAQQRSEVGKANADIIAGDDHTASLNSPDVMEPEYHIICDECTNLDEGI